MKILVKKVGKPFELIDYPWIDEGHEINFKWLSEQAVINDALGCINLSDKCYELMLYCDDAGYMKGLPINVYVDGYVPGELYPVVGNIIIARTELVGDSLYFYSLTDEDIITICRRVYVRVVNENNEESICCFGYEPNDYIEHDTDELRSLCISD